MTIIERLCDWICGPDWENEPCGKRGFEGWTNLEYWVDGQKTHEGGPTCYRLG